MKDHIIKPTPGYILVEPYVKKDKVFKSTRETAGEDQQSVVLEVGGNVIDSQGIEREASCKVGDVIIHAFTNKDFTIDTYKYRFVHFTEVHGLLEIK